MNETDPMIVQELAKVASRCHAERTGHAPKAATVVLSGDTLVVTLYEALTLQETILSQSQQGAAQVQESHRQLFANSIEELQQEILRITGRAVREPAAATETHSGSIVHAFTTGAVVQVFLLAPAAAGQTNGRAAADNPRG